MNFLSVFLVASIFAFSGCAKSANQSADQESTEAASVENSPDQAVAAEGPFQPFLIYSDKGTAQNHYIPSGFMPDGKCLTFTDTWSENCQSGKTCIKIVYDIDCSKQSLKWVGVYWQNPANNWGDKKGGFDLTGANKLTFWAKGERGGERIEEFKIGGITRDYPDSDSAMIGPVILTSEWTQYTIDLRGKDLSYISGGFAWATNVDVNPQSCTFYLDELKYE
jgi:hypothetical protein